MSNVSEWIGDNKEFTVATASDVTIYFNGGVTGDKTSADDDATTKYYDNYPSGGVKAFCLRNDKTCQILSFNGVDLTDPYTAVASKGITEKLDITVLFKMVIRTLQDSTNIKLRIR